EPVEVPREHLPDPDSENIPSIIIQQETAVDLERRWTDTAMGNEQSGSSNSAISSSLLFLGGRKNMTAVRKKANQVVVVRSGSDSAANPNEDPIFKRFKEIPKFYPVLKGALHQPGLHDSPDIKKKMSPRPIFRLATCLQDHLTRSAQLVANEQDSVNAEIKDVDYYAVTLLDKFNVYKKSMEVLTLQVSKLSDITAELEGMKSELEDLLPQIGVLNDLLPEADRLPPLSLVHLFDSSPSTNTSYSGTTSDNSSSSDDVGRNSLKNLHVEPIEEYAVIDKVVRR
ncbi:unnamed protein product, partial [Enterobius vermicularis]|uniref:BLOC-1-related complex subunit 5 n=1 Tax=Enterobius vermicularis TaxID=51028 RepID=A0A0N4V6I2_ENTVE